MTKRNLRTKVWGHIRKDLTSAHLLVITITLFDFFLLGMFSTYPWQNLISLRIHGLGGGLGGGGVEDRRETQLLLLCCQEPSHPLELRI